ncbi:FeoB-associated Cys-rich membrane protein [Helicobacter turcicus]|uniref:FeoB-associated Cys-rich membrane protein n=1 Tax=Helicobacter turcicus TaxID=2867412 RepID=A0ABS7JNR5_9HELI|nr:FeoB-associated Cys-rich membrane protein [Helicobacter turcicus]MBX7491012.1 FeoB-associated Cys-rich membrane protein [Helicobacter turcicus]MBX7545861.1 FeoB-associated Cys-rich membrane protein [Helicobacter turcicus]
MSDSILLAVIFILSSGYLAYKLYPKKGNNCGCGNCDCQSKSIEKNKISK